MGGDGPRTDHGEGVTANGLARFSPFPGTLIQRSLKRQALPVY